MSMKVKVGTKTMVILPSNTMAPILQESTLMELAVNMKKKTEKNTVSITTLPEIVF